MARYQKFAPVGQYQAKHITTALTNQPIGDTQPDGGQSLGAVVVNTLGTSPVITLFNGTVTIAVITPTAPGVFTYNCECPGGLKITTTGSGFDITVTYLDLVV